LTCWLCLNLRILAYRLWLINIFLGIVELHDIRLGCQRLYHVPLWAIDRTTANELGFIDWCWFLLEREIQLLRLKNRRDVRRSIQILIGCCDSTDRSYLPINFEIMVFLEPLPVRIKTCRVSSRQWSKWCPCTLSCLNFIIQTRF